MLTGAGRRRFAGYSAGDTHPLGVIADPHERVLASLHPPASPPAHPRMRGGCHPHTPALGAQLLAERKRLRPTGRGAEPLHPRMAVAPVRADAIVPDGCPDSGAWGGAPQIRRAGGWASELHCPAPRPSDGDSRAAAFPCAEGSLSSVSTSLYSEACHRKARPARCSPGPRVASAPRPCGAAGTAQRRPTRAARCRCPLRGDRARPSRSGAPAPAYRRCGRSRGRLRG